MSALFRASGVFPPRRHKVDQDDRRRGVPEIEHDALASAVRSDEYKSRVAFRSVVRAVQVDEVVRRIQHEPCFAAQAVYRTFLPELPLVVVREHDTKSARRSQSPRRRPVT